MLKPFVFLLVETQLLDGSFTMADSNLFLSPYKILLIAQENN